MAMVEEVRDGRSEAQRDAFASFRLHRRLAAEAEARVEGDEPCEEELDGINLVSAHMQSTLESRIVHFYRSVRSRSERRSEFKLAREHHVAYIRRGFTRLDCSYQCLDASRPWLLYWTLSALDLMGEVVEEEPLKESEEASGPGVACAVTEKDLERAWGFLARCQNVRSSAPPGTACGDDAEGQGFPVWRVAGGFGGGPGQLSHLAPTYAATNALMVMGRRAAFEVVDRTAMYSFLRSLKDESGGFKMHQNGEVDVRASYCALVAASVYNLLDDELVSGAAEYVARCQTFEGGFGGEPGNEAHGGYTFCGLAALCILGATDVIDIPALKHWLVHRQMEFEGGFQGRTNKLVDSCYSFWQGACFAMLELVEPHAPSPGGVPLDRSGALPQEETLHESGLLFNQRALQDYLLLCCQQVDGGMRDKPSKSRDFYHTCYALAGLSIAQHNPPSSAEAETVVGVPLNLVNKIDPVYGVRVEKVQKAKEHFATLPPPPFPR